MDFVHLGEFLSSFSKITLRFIYLLYISTVHSFLVNAECILLHEYTTICLSIHLLIDTWIISRFWLLNINLLYIHIQVFASTYVFIFLKWTLKSEKVVVEARDMFNYLTISEIASPFFVVILVIFFNYFIVVQLQLSEFSLFIRVVILFYISIICMANLVLTEFNFYPKFTTMLSWQVIFFNIHFTKVFIRWKICFKYVVNTIICKNWMIKSM